MTDTQRIRSAAEHFLPELTAFLDELIRFESLPGYEGPAMEWLYGKFVDIADECELVPVPEEITEDPDYSFTMDDRPYAGRPNLRAVLKGDGTGKSVILNAHVDVVPPSDGHERPFDPYVKDGCMYGRGAADDKGHVAVIWALFSIMKSLGLRPRGDVIAHIVIEEETGGNGTLAMIRRGEKADCCLNLDGGNNGNIYPSVRGAVWFTGTCYGRAGHSGAAGSTVSALKMAIEAMRIIEEYHGELLAETHGDDPLFADTPNPMPVTFGRLEAGDWPAMAPQKAVFQGVFGLLTTPKETVMRELVERVRTRGPEWLGDPGNFGMTFQYRHDMSRVDPESTFVRTLERCYREMGVDTKVGGFPASADTWFYTNLIGVPAVLTGMGGMGVAHTAWEHVDLNLLATLTAVMLAFVRDWCGMEG